MYDSSQYLLGGAMAVGTVFLSTMAVTLFATAPGERRGIAIDGEVPLLLEGRALVAYAGGIGLPLLNMLIPLPQWVLGLGKLAAVASIASLGVSEAQDAQVSGKLFGYIPLGPLALTAD